MDKLEKLFSRNLVAAFLVDLTDELLTKYYVNISVDNIFKLVRCLNLTNKAARDLNSQFDTRVKLWNVGLQADR